MGDNDTKNKIGKIDKIMHTALFTMLLISVMYLAAGEIILPNDRGVSSKDCIDLSESFEVVLDDGITENITLPTTYEPEQESDGITLSTTLANNIEHEWLMIWNMGHELEVYVGDELRFSLGKDERRLFKGDVAYQYDFVKLHPADAGKELKICYVDYAAENSNLGMVYAGDKASLMLEAVKGNQIALFLAVTMLVSGIVVAVVARLNRVKYPKMYSVQHLGVGVTIASAWFLFNSPAAQFIFPNIEIARDCAFFFASMISLPFLMYLKSLMGGRYARVLTGLEIASVAGFALLIICYFILKRDINIAFIPTLIIAVVGLGTALAIILGDFQNRHVKEYFLAALGTIIFVVFALIYVLMFVLFPFKGDSGILLMLGIMFLFILGIISAIGQK